MPIQAILDETAFGSLDDSLKSIYKQNTENNQYYLDLAPTEAEKLAFNLVSEKEKLANNNKELLKQKGEINAKLKAFESLGKSAEEIQKALEANRPEEVNRLLEEARQREDSLKTSYDESLKTEKSKVERYQQQLHRTAINNKIAQLRAQFDLNDTAEFVLRDYYRAEENEDGQVVTRIYGEDGKPALTAGQPMSDEQLLKNFQEQKRFLSIFNGGTGGGSGASNRQQTVNSGGKTMKWSEFNKLSHDARNKFMQDGGQTVAD
jgi:hypothetical protein